MVLADSDIVINEAHNFEGQSCPKNSIAAVLQLSADTVDWMNVRNQGFLAEFCSVVRWSMLFDFIVNGLMLLNHIVSGTPTVTGPFFQQIGWLQFV